MKDYQIKLRPIVRGVYDLQKLRIETGNRICATYKSKLGVKPSTKEKEQKEADKLLAKLRKEWKLITDGIVKLTQTNFTPSPLIEHWIEAVMVEQYIDLIRQEEAHFRRLTGVLSHIDIWRHFLSDVRGVGPAMAGVIVSEIDIEKAHYPSSLWKYAGLDVAGDGKGRSRRSEHLIERPYTDKNGEEKTRSSITFNPFLKTKLVGVLAGSFLRCTSPYRDAYDGYKHRLQNMPAHEAKSDGHRHNMAMRYMIKRFLVDLHCAWRPLEGLPVEPEYSEAKLGIVHRPHSDRPPQ